MPVPNRSLNFIKWIIFPTESAAFIHMRRPDEPAIKPVRPAVVPALDASRKLSLRTRDHARATMPAHVVKSADSLIVIAGNDNALASHLTQEVVARICNLIGAPSAYPGLAVEALHFVAEDLRIGVIPRWQRGCERFDLCAHFKY